MIEPVSIHADYSLLDLSIQCGICEKDFTPDDLEAHMKTHEAEESDTKASSDHDDKQASGDHNKTTEHIEHENKQTSKKSDKKLKKDLTDDFVSKFKDKQPENNAVEVIIQVFNKEHHESDKKLIDEVAVSLEKRTTTDENKSTNNTKWKQSEHDKVRMEPVTCELCGKQFDTKKKVNCHKRVHRKKDNEPNKSEAQQAKKGRKKTDTKKKTSVKEVKDDSVKPLCHEDQKNVNSTGPPQTIRQEQVALTSETNVSSVSKNFEEKVKPKKPRKPRTKTTKDKHQQSENLMETIFPIVSPNDLNNTNDVCNSDVSPENKTSEKSTCNGKNSVKEMFKQEKSGSKTNSKPNKKEVFKTAHQDKLLADKLDNTWHHSTQSTTSMSESESCLQGSDSCTVDKPKSDNSNSGLQNMTTTSVTTDAHKKHVTLASESCKSCPDDLKSDKRSDIFKRKENEIKIRKSTESINILNDDSGADKDLKHNNILNKDRKKASDKTESTKETNCQNKVPASRVVIDYKTGMKQLSENTSSKHEDDYFLNQTSQKEVECNLKDGIYKNAKHKKKSYTKDSRSTETIMTANSNSLKDTSYSSKESSIDIVKTTTKLVTDSSKDHTESNKPDQSIFDKQRDSDCDRDSKYFPNAKNDLKNPMKGKQIPENPMRLASPSDIELLKLYSIKSSIVRLERVKADFSVNTIQVTKMEKGTTHENIDFVRKRINSESTSSYVNKDPIESSKETVNAAECSSSHNELNLFSYDKENVKIIDEVEIEKYIKKAELSDVEKSQKHAKMNTNQPCKILRKKKRISNSEPKSSTDNNELECIELQAQSTTTSNNMNDSRDISTCETNIKTVIDVTVESSVESFNSNKVIIKSGCGKRDKPSKIRQGNKDVKSRKQNIKNCENMYKSENIITVVEDTHIITDTKSDTCVENKMSRRTNETIATPQSEVHSITKTKGSILNQPLQLSGTEINLVKENCVAKMQNQNNSEKASKTTNCNQPDDKSHLTKNLETECLDNEKDSLKKKSLYRKKNSSKNISNKSNPFELEKGDMSCSTVKGKTKIEDKPQSEISITQNVDTPHEKQVGSYQTRTKGKGRRRNEKTTKKLSADNSKMNKETCDNSIASHGQTHKPTLEMSDDEITFKSKVKISEKLTSKNSVADVKHTAEQCNITETKSDSIKFSDQTEKAETENISEKLMDVSSSSDLIIDPVRLPEKEIEQTLFALGLGTSSIPLSDSNSKNKGKAKKRKNRSKSPQQNSVGKNANKSDQKWFQNFDPLNPKKLRDRTGKTSWLKHTFDTDTESDDDWEIELPLVETTVCPTPNKVDNVVNANNKTEEIKAADSRNCIVDRNLVQEPKLCFDMSKDTSLCKKHGITKARIKLVRLSEEQQQQLKTCSFVKINQEASRVEDDKENKELSITLCQAQHHTSEDNPNTKCSESHKIYNTNKVEKDESKSDKVKNLPIINAHNTEEMNKIEDENEVNTNRLEKNHKESNRGRKRNKSFDRKNANKKVCVVDNTLSKEEAKHVKNCQSENTEKDEQKHELLVDKQTSDDITQVCESIVAEGTAFFKEESNRLLEISSEQTDVNMPEYDSEFCFKLKTTNTDITEQCNTQKTRQKPSNQLRKVRGRKKGRHLNKSNVSHSIVEDTMDKSGDITNTAIDRYTDCESIMKPHHEDRHAPVIISAESIENKAPIQVDQCSLKHSPDSSIKDKISESDVLMSKEAAFIEKIDMENQNEQSGSCKRRGRPRRKVRCQLELKDRERKASCNVLEEKRQSKESETDKNVSNENTTEKAISKDKVKDKTSLDLDLCTSEQANEVPVVDIDTSIEHIKSHQTDTLMSFNTGSSQDNDTVKPKRGRSKGKKRVFPVRKQKDICDSENDNNHEDKKGNNIVDHEHLGKIPSKEKETDIDLDSRSNIIENNRSQEKCPENMNDELTMITEKGNDEIDRESLPISKHFENLSSFPTDQNKDKSIEYTTYSIKEDKNLTYYKNLDDKEQIKSSRHPVHMPSDTLSQDAVSINKVKPSTDGIMLEQEHISVDRCTEELVDTIPRLNTSLDEILIVNEFGKTSGTKKRRGRPKSQRKGAYKPMQKTLNYDLSKTQSEEDKIKDAENIEEQNSKTDLQGSVSDIPPAIEDKISTIEQVYSSNNSAVGDHKIVPNSSLKEKEKYNDFSNPDKILGQSQKLIHESFTQLDASIYTDNESKDLSNKLMNENIKDDENVKKLVKVNRKRSRGRKKGKGKRRNLSLQKTEDISGSLISMENLIDVMGDTPTISTEYEIVCKNSAPNCTKAHQKPEVTLSNESCKFETVAEIHFHPGQKDETSTRGSSADDCPKLNTDNVHQTKNELDSEKMNVSFKDEGGFKTLKVSNDKDSNRVCNEEIDIIQQTGKRIDHPLKLDSRHCEEILPCEDDKEVNQDMTLQDGIHDVDDEIVINEPGRLEEFPIKKRGRRRKKGKEVKLKKRSSVGLKESFDNQSSDLQVDNNPTSHAYDKQSIIEFEEFDKDKVAFDKRQMSMPLIPISPKQERNIFLGFTTEQTRLNNVNEISKLDKECLHTKTSFKETRETVFNDVSSTHSKEIIDHNSADMSLVSNDTEIVLCQSGQSKQIDQQNIVPQTVTDVADKMLDIVNSGEAASHAYENKKKRPVPKRGRRTKRGRIGRKIHLKDSVDKTGVHNAECGTASHNKTLNESGNSSQNIPDEEQSIRDQKIERVQVDPKSVTTVNKLEAEDICESEENKVEDPYDEKIENNVTDEFPKESSNVNMHQLPSEHDWPVNHIESQHSNDSVSFTEDEPISSQTDKTEIDDNQSSVVDKEKDSPGEQEESTESSTSTNWPSDIVLAFTPLQDEIVKQRREHRKKRKKMIKMVQSMNDNTGKKDLTDSEEKPARISTGKGFYIQRIIDNDKDCRDEQKNDDDRLTDLVNPKLIIHKTGKKSWEAKTVKNSKDSSLDTSILGSLDQEASLMQQSDDNLERFKILRVNDGKICTEDYDATQIGKIRKSRMKRKRQQMPTSVSSEIKKSKVQDQYEQAQDSKDTDAVNTLDFPCLQDTNYNIERHEADSLTERDSEEARYFIQPGSERENVLVMKRMGSPRSTGELSHDSGASQIISTDVKADDNSDSPTLETDALDSLLSNMDEITCPLLSQDRKNYTESNVEKTKMYEEVTVGTSKVPVVSSNSKRGRRPKRGKFCKKQNNIVQESNPVLSINDKDVPVMCNSDLFKIDNLLSKDERTVSSSTTALEREINTLPYTHSDSEEIKCEDISLADLDKDVSAHETQCSLQSYHIQDNLNETNTADISDTATSQSVNLENALIDRLPDIDITDVSVNSHVPKFPTQVNKGIFRGKRGRGKKRKLCVKQDINKTASIYRENTQDNISNLKRPCDSLESSVVKTSCMEKYDSTTNTVQDSNATEIVRKSRNLKVKLVRLSQADIDRYKYPIASVRAGASVDSKSLQQAITLDCWTQEGDDLKEVVSEVIDDMICAICEDEADKTCDTLFVEQVSSDLFNKQSITGSDQCRTVLSACDKPKQVESICSDPVTTAIGSGVDHIENIDTFDFKSVMIDDKDYVNNPQCSVDDNQILTSSEKIDVIDFESALNDEQILLKEDLDSTKIASGFGKSLDHGVNDETDIFYEETDDIIDRNIVQSESAEGYGLEDEIKKEISDIREETINRQSRYEDLEGEADGSQATGCPDVSKIISDVNNISYRLKKVCGKIKNDRLDGF